MNGFTAPADGKVINPTSGCAITCGGDIYNNLICNDKFSELAKRLVKGPTRANVMRSHTHA